MVLRGDRRDFMKMLGGGLAATAGFVLMPGMPKPDALPLVIKSRPLTPIDPNGPFIPKLWAKEALDILSDKMVRSNLVSRDFCETIKAHDDMMDRVDYLVRKHEEA